MTAPTPDLNAIQARSDRALAGPWVVDDGWFILKPDTPGFSTDGTVVATLQEGEHGLYETETSEFIAHAREDVPALLEALAAVTAERDRARQVIADAPHGATCEVIRAFRPSAPCECWKATL